MQPMAQQSKECKGKAIEQVHGFFHSSTNLDFYHLPINKPSLYTVLYDVVIGDHKFSREYSGTISSRRLDIMHNMYVYTMGTRKWKGGAYLAFWEREAPTKFPEAIIEKCTPLLESVKIGK